MASYGYSAPRRPHTTQRTQLNRSRAFWTHTKAFFSRFVPAWDVSGGKEPGRGRRWAWRCVEVAFNQSSDPPRHTDHPRSGLRQGGRGRTCQTGASVALDTTGFGCANERCRDGRRRCRRRTHTKQGRLAVGERSCEAGSGGSSLGLVGHSPAATPREVVVFLFLAAGTPRARLRRVRRVATGARSWTFCSSLRERLSLLCDSFVSW